MGEEQQNSQNHKRRRRRRRRSTNRNTSQNNNSQSNNNNSRQRNNNNNHHPRKKQNHQRSNKDRQSEYVSKTPKDKFGGREPLLAEEDREYYCPEVTPFDLFCLYHLGITDNNGYRKPNARDCARRLRVSMDEMHDALRRYGLDNKSFDDYDFDLNLARLDIRVAPKGIDRREIAKLHYTELLEYNAELSERLAAIEIEDAKIAEEAAKAAEEAAKAAEEAAKAAALEAEARAHMSDDDDDYDDYDDYDDDDDDYDYDDDDYDDDYDYDDDIEEDVAAV